MNLATDGGALNLAGLLLFGEQPQRFKPQFVVKAVKYPGTDIHTSRYDDTEDFSGPLRRVFDDALAFVLRNLRKVQAGRGVNSPGMSEIPPVVFEELLVNALVHRDYLINAPIRLFVFDDRIEVISRASLQRACCRTVVSAPVSRVHSRHGRTSSSAMTVKNYPENYPENYST